ncbi:MAG: hypothetical protein B6D41_10050 [Chloroflexi bacterium UTCFX4]|nr:MAG: hypothetical protein B6D41_10050 [Chloroflexi bacterium UTCFX4]
MDIGVKEGDTLRLLPNVMAGGILPVRTIRDILVTDAILSKIESNPPSLSAIFLYTDWDISLAEFIRNNIDEIDRLAGQECNAFIIEEPTERWVEKNKSSLKKEIGENFDFLWNRLDWASSKPYNKSEAIEIGRRFSIEPEELPVIIIFNSGDSKDYLLVSLNRILASVTDDAEQDYKRFFRKFFSLTSQASKYPAEIRLTMLDKMVKETWKSRQTGKNSLGITEIVKQISLDISLAEMIKLVLAVFGKITP